MTYRDIIDMSIPFYLIQFYRNDYFFTSKSNS